MLFTATDICCHGGGSSSSSRRCGRLDVSVTPALGLTALTGVPLSHRDCLRRTSIKQYARHFFRYSSLQIVCPVLGQHFVRLRCRSDDLSAGIYYRQFLYPVLLSSALFDWSNNSENLCDFALLISCPLHTTMTSIHFKDCLTAKSNLPF